MPAFSAMLNFMFHLIPFFCNAAPQCKSAFPSKTFTNTNQDLRLDRKIRSTLTLDFLSMGLMVNFLSLNEIFRISLQGNPILGVSLEDGETCDSEAWFCGIFTSRKWSEGFTDNLVMEPGEWGQWPLQNNSHAVKLDRLEGKAAEVDDWTCAALPRLQLRVIHSWRDKSLTLWLTCPASRRCSVPERRLPTTALCPSCSWCQSSSPRTFPGPGRSSGTPLWPHPC